MFFKYAIAAYFKKREYSNLKKGVTRMPAEVNFKRKAKHKCLDNFFGDEQSPEEVEC